MKLTDFVKAVQQCPRATWTEQGLSLRTLKRNPPRAVSGFMVGKRTGSKVALISDAALADSIAMNILALQSTKRKLLGFLIRPVSDIKIGS